MKSKAWMITLLVICTSLLVSPVSAQVDAVEPQEVEEAKPAGKLLGPVAVVNATSIDGLLDDVDYLFTAADRPELSQIVFGALATVGNLKGIDRKKPTGLLIYLQNVDEEPEPVVVGYVPVTNVADLQRTVQIGPIRMVRDEEDDNLYSLEVEDESVPVLIRRGYAFITEKAEHLDLAFPDPVTLTKNVTGVYDFSFSLLIGELPQAVRDKMVKEMRSDAAEDLKRRKSETELEHRARNAGAEMVFRFAEQVITQGQDFSVGWNISRQDKEIQIETRLTAQADSKLSTTLKNLGSQQTQFGSLVGNKVPFSLNFTLAPPDDLQQVFVDALTQAQKEVEREIPPEDQAPVKDLIASLQATAKSPPLDFALQLNGEPPNPFSILAASKVGNGKQMGEAVQKIFDIATKKYDVPNLKASVATSNGVAIHQIIPDPQDLDDEITQLFGEEPQVYLAVSGDALWFSFGGDAALADLKAAVKAPLKKVDKTKPAEMVLRFSSWMGLIAEEADDPNFVQIATKAFAPGGDAIRLELTSEETAARVRLSFEEGFIRLIGLGIVSGMGQ